MHLGGPDLEAPLGGLEALNEGEEDVLEVFSLHQIACFQYPVKHS